MTDTYTKICLTVIAVSLTVIGLRGLPVVESAFAQSGSIQKIAICDPNSKRCVEVTGKRWLKTFGRWSQLTTDKIQRPTWMGAPSEPLFHNKTPMSSQNTSTYISGDMSLLDLLGKDCLPTCFLMVLKLIPCPTVTGSWGGNSLSVSVFCFLGDLPTYSLLSTRLPEVNLLKWISPSVGLWPEEQTLRQASSICGVDVRVVVVRWFRIWYWSDL